MDIDVRKWIPWNWFRKEQEQEGIPVRRAGVSQAPVRHDDLLPALHQEIDRLFGRFVQSLDLPWGNEAGRPWRSAGQLLKPSVDIRETARAYVVTLEVPGVDEQDLQLELSDRNLVIRGEKKQESTGNDETYHWVERSYGAFQRVLSLPEDALDDDIHARFKRGVLTITVPRRESARTPRRVIDVRPE